MSNSLAIAAVTATLSRLLGDSLKDDLGGGNVTTVSQLLRFFARRSFDTLRGVDTLVWALIWVNVVGLGPFAGVLAIMSSDIGSFGKLFSEAIEATDKRAEEGILASGGSRLQSIRFGIIPQVLPVLHHFR